MKGLQQEKEDGHYAPLTGLTVAQVCVSYRAPWTSNQRAELAFTQTLTMAEDFFLHGANCIPCGLLNPLTSLKLVFKGISRLWGMQYNRD